MYQCSVGVGGAATTAGSGMGIAVGGGVGVAVRGRAPVVVGVGEHQALAQVLGQGPVHNGPKVRVQGVHPSLGHQARHVHTEGKGTKTNHSFLSHLHTDWKYFYSLL